MEALVAPVSNVTLDIESQLALQLGALPLPFPGMDKSGSAVTHTSYSLLIQLHPFGDTKRTKTNVLAVFGRCVSSTSDRDVPRLRPAPSGTSEETRQSSASIGCEDSARKETVANFSTSMTCQKCQNVTSTQDSVSFRQNLHSTPLHSQIKMKLSRGRMMDFKAKFTRLG